MNAARLVTDNLFRQGRKEWTLTPELKTKLLASLDAGRLVIICGAGLSMASPSSLPSALRVAQKCFDEHALITGANLDPGLRGNLEVLAEHFVELGELHSIFIERLVPWRDFVKPPNEGHVAIADLLLTHSLAAAISSNYDVLIEQSAAAYGADFLASLDGDEATVRTHIHGPLLKFHGCAQRDRRNTVWSASQIETQPLAGRIDRTRTWMAANLREKDFLVVGFWTDWDYLNSVIGSALEGVTPRSVTLVDLDTEERLQQKAPGLWELAHRDGVLFTHVRESGAAVLSDLRRGFSASYIRKILAAGRDAVAMATGVPCDPQWLEVREADLTDEEFYAWRRDAEGVPVGQPATARTPRSCEILGCFHLLVRKAGGTPTGTGYVLNNKSVRIINGAGTILATLKSRFVESPAIEAADIVVAVGATDIGLPSDIVRTGFAGDIVRPAAAGRWLDFQQAKAELEL